MILTKRLFSSEFRVPEFLSQKHISSLDGLRACSIIIVILAHLNFTINSTVLHWFVNGGFLGVQVFFVISGFLITTLLIREKVSKGSINLRKFYIRRFLRIVPVAFLYIIVLVIINFCFKLGIRWTHFLHQLTFTENFDAGFSWQTGHYWSLSVEEQFYLLFPFLLKWNVKWYIIISLILLMLSPVFGVLYHNYIKLNQEPAAYIIYPNLFLNSGLYAIIVGSLSAVLLCKYKFNIMLKPYLVGLTQCVLVVAIFFFFKTPFVGGFNLVIEVGCIAFLIISTIYFGGHGFYKFLNLRLMKVIGVLSYSIYIWQQLFTYHQPWHNSFVCGDSLVLNMIVLMAVAYTSYNFFEKPFLVLKERFKA